MRRLISIIAGSIAALALLFSCDGTASLEKQLDDLDSRVDNIQTLISTTNTNNVALKALLDSKTLIVAHEETSDGVRLDLSDGSKVEIFYGNTAAWIVPIVGIDEEGRWTVSIDGGQTFTYVRRTTNIHEGDGITPEIGVDTDGYWTMSMDGGKTFTRILTPEGFPISARDGREVAGAYSFFKNAEYNAESSVMTFSLLDGRVLEVPVVQDFFLNVKGFTPGQTICLGETKAYEIEAGELESAIFRGPEGWGAVLTDSELRVTAPETASGGSYTITLLAVSTKGYIRTYEYVYTLKPIKLDDSDCDAWNKFLSDSEENVLLDFSYAGYHHGEEAPADVYTLGYKVYDVTDYGAVPNDGKSDREAFLNCLKAAIGVDYAITDNYLVFNSKSQANVIIYFPEGEFILHTSEDDATSTSREIIIRSGNIVLKGAGRDKTRILMKDPNLPANSEMYSSPAMISFRHWSGLTDYSTPITVAENAAKGSFSVKVSSTTGLAKDAWVCLWAEITDPDYIAAELSPYAAKASWDISKMVKIYDYHQIKSVSGKEVTFYEPVMHAVDASKNFMLKNYNHYENVGVEDITFAGNAVQDFVHHRSWNDDGGFKPLIMARCVNSWVRRCDFESTSEAMTFHTCANCSGYDVRFTGWRGHAAMRSAASSRIFIGATDDLTKGPVDANNPNIAKGTFMENAGQFHGVGVNGPTMGTVLWRNVWGDDSCFESHADQPRATLIDCCKGGWMEYRQGGGTAAMPNHLADLTIWNFNSTTEHKAQWTSDGTFLWWATNNRSINYLPPIIVGFHGGACKFDPASVVINESQGTPVSPESLYEAQLRKRLGFVPAWLNSLK